jgi:nitroreductase
MKRTGLFLLISIFAMQMMAQDIKLLPPQKTGGMPLMDALNARKTDRDYSEKMLDDQLLSNLLWAANGINRADGRLTAPTARNMQQIEMYLFMPTGIYLYIAKDHSLKKVVDGDHRKSAAKSPWAQVAPITIVLVANLDKMKGLDEDAIKLYSGTDCGNVCQNIYLFCASEKLHTVELGMIDKDAIAKLLNCNGLILLGQPVGYPK